MASQFDLLREANRALLARIAEREEALKVRARQIEDELTAIENERRNLASDRDTIHKVEAIQLRMLGSFVPAVAEGGPRLEAGQSRARIGTKRYAMWTTLRSHAPITVEGIASRTGLSAQRIRDQMKADQPLYVTAGPNEGGDAERPTLILTLEGNSLLTRFENYRRSQGKPLPTLEDVDDASDDDEAKAGADHGDADAQTNEAAGEVSMRDAPTASDQDAAPGIFD